MKQPEPWVYEEARQEEFEEWAKKRPWCQVCDEVIQDETCYVMEENDKINSCICKKCMEEEFNLMRKSKVSVYLREALAELVEYQCEQRTPEL